MLAGLSALILATGCTEDGVPDLKTAPALAGIESALASTLPNGDLDECPVDDFETLLGDSFDLLDDELVDRSLLGETQAARFETASTPSEAIVCAQRSDTGEALGFYLLEAPADILTFSNESTGLPIGAVTVEVSESRLFRGGQFFKVCVEANEAAELGYCQVNWLDENVMVSAFASGSGAFDLDVNALQERFQYILPTIIDRLGDS